MSHNNCWIYDPFSFLQYFLIFLINLLELSSDCLYLTIPVRLSLSDCPSLRWWQPSCGVIHLEHVQHGQYLLSRGTCTARAVPVDPWNMYSAGSTCGAVLIAVPLCAAFRSGTSTLCSVTKIVWSRRERACSRAYVRVRISSRAHVLTCPQCYIQNTEHNSAMQMTTVVHDDRSNCEQN